METQDVRLTYSALSQIINTAWLVAREARTVPSQHDLVDTIFAVPSEIPRSITDLLHVTLRIDGPAIAEYTDLILEAQESNLIERPNPTSATGKFKVNHVQALNLLDRLSVDFPGEVEWVMKRFRSSAAGVETTSAA